MCCHEHPLQGPPSRDALRRDPAEASSEAGPKWGQYGLTRCGEGRRTDSSVAYVTPARGGPVVTRTRSPGMVKGTLSSRPPRCATPSPAAFSSSISTSTVCRTTVTSSNVQQLDVEEQGRVRRNDAAGAACAVPVRRGERQRAPPADLHSGNALIPAANHLAGAQAECKRVVPIARAVELHPLVVGGRGIVQPAGVVHRDAPAGRRFVATADDRIGLDQLGDVRLRHVHLAAAPGGGNDGKEKCENSPPHR